ncbi:MAG: hypothetical protein WKF73_18390 [Nocardioidaceae bacterium]
MGRRRHRRPPLERRWYALHLASSLVYGLITYTMALRLRTGVDFALLFALAIGLHSVLRRPGGVWVWPGR